MSYQCNKCGNQDILVEDNLLYCIICGADAALNTQELDPWEAFKKKQNRDGENVEVFLADQELDNSTQNSGSSQPD
jgi:hypothetical protein